MATIRMPEHQPHQHGDTGEDYNIATLVAVTVIGLLSLVWSVVWLKAVYARADRWEWDRKVVLAPFSEREKLHDAQNIQLLQGYEWTDPAHNRVSLPLTEVENRVLNQLRTEQLPAARPGAPVLPLGGINSHLAPTVTELPETVAVPPAAAGHEAEPQPIGETPPASETSES